MKAGVSTVPWGVCQRPTRPLVDASVRSSSKKKAGRLGTGSTGFGRKANELEGIREVSPERPDDPRAAGFQPVGLGLRRLGNLLVAAETPSGSIPCARRFSR